MSASDVSVVTSRFLDALLFAHSQAKSPAWLRLLDLLLKDCTPKMDMKVSLLLFRSLSDSNRIQEVACQCRTLLSRGFFWSHRVWPVVFPLSLCAESSFLVRNDPGRCLLSFTLGQGWTYVALLHSEPHWRTRPEHSGCFFNSSSGCGGTSDTHR